ncbi:unnamed protein product [Urochloa humidicola]
MAPPDPSSGAIAHSDVVARRASPASARLRRVAEGHIYGAGGGWFTGRVVRLPMACCSAAGPATPFLVRREVASGGRKTKRHSVAATSWVVCNGSSPVV